MKAESEPQEIEWWWVDYLERELDIGLEQDIQFLLANSKTDRENFAGLEALRQWIKDCDPFRKIAVTEERLVRMKDKIMQSIESEDGYLVTDLTNAPRT